MKTRSKQTDQAAPRQKQDVPDVVIGRLLALVRGQFCGDLSDKEWYQNAGFVRLKVLLWPAGFMLGKGFTLPVARYEAIMRAIFMEIKHHGQTAVVRYWPGYLMKCVQDHWKHHWEEYYQEAKSARSWRAVGAFLRRMIAASRRWRQPNGCCLASAGRRLPRRVNNLTFSARECPLQTSFRSAESVSKP